MNFWENIATTADGKHISPSEQHLRETDFLKGFDFLSRVRNKFLVITFRGRTKLCKKKQRRGFILTRK